MENGKLIHASLLVLNGHGILIRGASGSGKSDLALRLIENKQALLVADDVVIIQREENAVKGTVPENTAGLLEIRGIGILEYPYVKSANIDLVVELRSHSEEIERLPLKQKEVILGLEINKIDLYAKENSAPDKVAAFVRTMGKNSDNWKIYRDVEKNF